MFEVEFSQLAEKQLLKLPNDVQIRIVSTLDRIKIRPHAHILKLVGSPYFRLRVGDYRVILDVQGNTLLIFVISIGHRKNIYQK
jgi:mRNA interferase RelE/StbE